MIYLEVLGRVWMPPEGLDATPRERLLGATLALLAISILIFRIFIDIAPVRLGRR